MTAMKHAPCCTVFGVLGLLTGCGHPATVSEAPHDVDRSLECLPSAATPEELAKAIDRFITPMSSEELDRLACSPESTMALAAGWARVLRTIPEGAQTLNANNKRAMSRFVGLIEGRLRVPIPPVWEAAVRSADYNGQLIGYRVPERVAEIAEGTRLDAPRTRLRREQDRWIVAHGTEEWSLPAEDHLGPVVWTSIELGSTTAYLALYGWPPIPYKVYAVDRSSARIVWSSVVWGGGGLLNENGQGWHAVDLRTTSDTLVVFGVSEIVAYVEVLDKRSGDLLCRFSTGYFRPIFDDSE